MTTPPPIADAVTDLNGFSRLRAAARDNPQDPQTLRNVAAQFEALFTQLVLKSMREASLGDPLLGERDDHYRDLFDQQLAMQLASGRGLGLADALARQLGRAPAVAPAQPAPAAAPLRFQSPQQFVSELWPLARATGQTLGVAPEALLAQAALESGWGGKVLHDAQGRSSFNLFGIKADAGWRGARMSAPTLEAVDGVMVQRTASFRAYGSYAEAFADYADFLRTNPRYGTALEHGADTPRFFEALQEAGYATDPAYAAKLRAILQSETGTALKSDAAVPLTSERA